MKSKEKDFNFRFIAKWDGTEALLTDVSLLTSQDWSYFTVRQKTIVGHRDTLTIPLIFDWKKKSNKIVHKHYDAFSEHILGLSRFMQSLGEDCEIMRANLVMLKSHSSIATHTDAGDFLASTRRVHLPLTTNDDCFFIVGTEQQHLRCGELWEINNTGKPHSVHNHGGIDRIHLIVDVM